MGENAKRPADLVDGEPFHLGYRRWLDGLRGIAILMVLAFHFRFVPGGWLGVDVFLVLSGFLITCLLTEEWRDEGSISLKRFYLRRCLRLWPAFYSLLLVALVVSFWQGSETGSQLRREIPVAACYITNWPSLHGVPMPVLGHSWSLALEEQFYLLWPMLLYAMLRWRIPRAFIVGFVVLGIVGAAVLRLALFHAQDPSGPSHEALIRLYVGLDTRADSLLIGCLVGLLAAWNWLPRSRGFVIFTSVGSVAGIAGLAYLVQTCLLNDPRFYQGLFTLVGLAVAVIIVRLLSAPSWLRTVLEVDFLVATGRISYALYLIHIPAMEWLNVREMGWRAPGESLLVIAVTFAAAILSFFCIERPCLKLKHRFGSTKKAGGFTLRLPAPAATRSATIHQTSDFPPHSPA
jgi:peptidoglycan/LPS O-acetylase OafA/YrhL